MFCSEWMRTGPVLSTLVLPVVVCNLGNTVILAAPFCINPARGSRQCSGIGVRRAARKHDLVSAAAREHMSERQAHAQGWEWKNEGKRGFKKVGWISSTPGSKLLLKVRTLQDAAIVRAMAVIACTHAGGY